MYIRLQCSTAAQTAKNSWSLWQKEDNSSIYGHFSAAKIECTWNKINLLQFCSLDIIKSPLLFVVKQIHCQQPPEYNSQQCSMLRNLQIHLHLPLLFAFPLAFTISCNRLLLIIVTVISTILYLLVKIIIINIITMLL